MELVIVESPAKAKTIEKFLGKGFTVKSSYGHVRDLSKKELGIDTEGNFEPNYEVMPDKKKVITELKGLTKKAETVWLATDEDREGEAISWHLAETLKLKPASTKRIVFSEITKSAITKAVENPRQIDYNLVNAQQARRVLDRLVGFELSPVLWKKVKPSLSAGRVQSVAVRLLVEREKEIMAFEATSAFRVVAEFKNSEGKIFKAELNKRFPTEEEAKSFLEDSLPADFPVLSIEKKPGKRSPAAPFTTSTLQQEASRKLGYPVGMTMSVAQKLYEAGLITYMRTDSVNLSDLAIGAAKDQIVSQYGAEFSNPKKYSTKNKGAQEAHEAIRPTYLDRPDAGSDSREQKLYDLIYKRTLASQMANAEIEKTTYKIGNTKREEVFTANGEVIKFEGFLKVYIEGSDDENAASPLNKDVLPALKEGDNLAYDSITATQNFTRYPARFTEASLVRKLEELGIGRPSTYAPTISTIQKRNYVVKEDREGKERNYQELALIDGKIATETKVEMAGREKGKLFPTDIGIVVNDFLVEHFANIMDYSFTRDVEEDFDQIANGKQDWQQMIKTFYGPFHETIEQTIEHADRASGERHLGEDPKTGKPVIARIGRYGPMVQIGDQEDEEKKFASIRGDASLQSITLEQALELFKLPKQLGTYEDTTVNVGIGRFGPYVRFGNKFVSLGKRDPLDVSLDEAIELIEAKKKADAEREIADFGDERKTQILRGRYGPYIKIDGKNVKIPKDRDPEELTLDDCYALAEEAKKAPPKKRRKK